MNTIKLLTLSFILLLSSTSLADKPAWAGKSKPSAEQKEAHKKAMNSKEDGSGDKEKKFKEKKAKKQKSKDKKAKKEKSKNHENDKDGDNDKEKQSRNMKTKSVDDMKEIDKGSEKGIEQREEKRKKWWNLFN